MDETGTEEDKGWNKRAGGARRCGAPTKSGAPCRFPAVIGGDRCWNHHPDPAVRLAHREAILRGARAAGEASKERARQRAMTLKKDKGAMVRFRTARRLPAEVEWPASPLTSVKPRPWQRELPDMVRGLAGPESAKAYQQRVLLDYELGHLSRMDADCRARLIRGWLEIDVAEHRRRMDIEQRAMVRILWEVLSEEVQDVIVVERIARRLMDHPQAPWNMSLVDGEAAGSNEGTGG